MAKTYTTKELATLATQRAEEAKGEAVRWWVTEGDPLTLHVAVEITLLSGRTLSAHLQEPLETGNPISR